MSSCNLVQTILGTECIGDSLPKINGNFENLDTAVCDLSSSKADFLLPFSFRNKLINAQGFFNQRSYTSGAAATSDNFYTLDRWRIVSTGEVLTFTSSQNVRTFTAPAGGLEQVIDGGDIESGVYVLNWNGTATATVNGTPRAKGDIFTLVGGSNTTVRFSAGTFSLPQLEKSTTPTAFEYRPRGIELGLCQRYFERTFNSIQSSSSVTWYFRERKRTSPTFSNTTSGMTQVELGVDAVTVSNATTATIGANSFADAEF